MNKRAPQASRDVLESWLFADHLEPITDGLASWVARVIRIPPPEPCPELSFWDISVAEWRRALDQWCSAGFVRRAYGFEATEGLRLALADFDDQMVIAFLESLI